MPVQAESVALSRKDGAAEQPFYFIVVLWGNRFRNYFLDLCLATLLSPGNMPSLAKQPRSKFLICTRPDDWEAIQAAPIFALLSQYVDPVFVEIPPCPPGASGCVHMGTGHRQACQMAFDDKAYPFVVTPDSMLSDGIIRRLRELAKNGVELVMVPALRFAEEPLFLELAAKGIQPVGRNASAQPISLTGRELAGLSLASMHSETQSYEWNAPYFHQYPSAAWWRVPEGDGIVLHSFSWAPLLFDFRAVDTHDTTTFDNWTFDGDYVYRNLGKMRNLHLVLDSDEMFIASWAPLSDRPYDLKPRRSLQIGPVSDLVRNADFQSYFYSGVFDPLKQSIFFHPIRWHASDIDDKKWARIETKAYRQLTRAVGSPKQDRSDLVGDLIVRSVDAKRVPNLVKFTNRVLPVIRAFRWTHNLWTHRKSIASRLLQAARGDRYAMNRIRWHFSRVLYKIRGKQLDIPQPKLPAS